MCFPLCLTIKKPSLADKSIPQGLFLFPYASNRKLVFLNIFVTGPQPRMPNVHHFQSHIKIWGQMPFLHLHPGPFIPPKKLEDNSSTPSLQTGEEINCSLGHQRTGDDRAQPMASLLMKKSPRLQVQLLM